MDESLVVTLERGRYLVRRRFVSFLGFVSVGPAVWALLSPFGGVLPLRVLVGVQGRPLVGVGPVAASWVSAAWRGEQPE